jgi:ABC-type bacteriocin/lantibiotic exporter with double-glycine peptidase domain
MIITISFLLGIIGLMFSIRAKKIFEKGLSEADSYLMVMEFNRSRRFRKQSTVFLVFSIGLFLVGITVMRILQMHLSEYLQRRLFLKAIEDTKNYVTKNHESQAEISKKKLNYIFESISLQKSIIPLFFDGFTFFLQSVLVMVLISIYHPFFVMYCIILVAAFYWVTVVMGRKTLGFAVLESNKKHELIEELQQYSIDSPMASNVEVQMLEYFNLREKKYANYMKQSIGLFIIKILAATLLLIIGGVLVFKNQMTIGQLIASELIVTSLLISLFKFSNILDYYYDAATAIKKLKILEMGGAK